MEKWILSANPNYFNHREAFHQLGFIDWKQTRHFKVGDIVYIYVTKPISAIMYKTEVIEVDMDEANITDLSSFWLKRIDGTSKSKSYARLKMIEEYSDDIFSYAVLSNHGMKYPPQSPCRVKQELQDFIDRYEEN